MFAGIVDSANEGAEAPAEEVQGGEEDRSPSVPLPVHEGQGKCLQEQESPDGIHPQEEG